MPNTKDPQNPYAPVKANDPGMYVVQLVIDWYRTNRNVLNAAQQSAAITAITNILNGTANV